MNTEPIVQEPVEHGEPGCPGEPGGTHRLTVAQALIAFLGRQFSERDGVRHRLIDATWGIFGHGNVAGLGQALVQHQDLMPFHQGRNEQAMVHAAVGFARQQRRLSVQAVTTSIGPGATNLVTGAALATVNHLPVLLLPGDTFAGRPADPVLQQLQLPYAGDVSVNDCLRPVSRYFDRVHRPEALVPAALAAMRALTDPVAAGAVTLALPQDVQAEAYDWPVEFFAERVWPVRRPVPQPDELAAAVREITAARRPLIVVGGGVRHSGAEEALARLADATGIPVACTQSGKGALPHGHPAEVGGIGHTGTATANSLARQADLLIGVGTRWTDFTTASGTLFTRPGVRFLNLNVAPFDAHKMAATTLVADAREALRALAEVLDGHRADEELVREYTGAKAAWDRAADTAYRAPDPEARPTQTQVIGALDEVTDGTDILINAAGSLPGDLHKLWRARSADQYHVEYGYSCMGYEIPAAVGVGLAAPGRRVWALVGDGTYLMNPTEIVTAVQLGLPFKLLILQNHGYASIGGLSRSVGAGGFGTDYRFRAEDGTYSGDPLPVDLAANAASLGLRVLQARSVAELVEALRTARDAEDPVCVHVETAPAPEPGPGGEQPDGAAPDSGAWWDVPVAEVSGSPGTVRAREEYEAAVAERRTHL